MRIENIRTAIDSGHKRAIATLVWEKRDRPSQEIFFETTEDFAEDLTANPQAFLIAGIIPAMRYGESRIAIDAEISPELYKGLTAVMEIFSYWYGEKRKPIPIEAIVRKRSLTEPKSKRAGLFFSGGVDSLSALRTNRLAFAEEHPRAVKDGILIYGLLSGETEPEQSYTKVIEATTKIAVDAGLNLIPVTTNIYSHLQDLDRDFNFWKFEYQGAALAAVAHALASRFSTVSIASTYNLEHLAPWGSHPLIDPNYSSSELQITHEDLTLSRWAKTKLIADWDMGLQNLRVCSENQSYRQGQLNCGKCEKCVRTMTTLIALDKLDRATAFSASDLSEDLLVKAAYISDLYTLSCYQDLIEPLKARGRHDLVRGIKRATTSYFETDLKGLLKRSDRYLFGGNLLKLSNKFKKSV
ncbi:hypothetical protein [Myxosarcina sp. GI1]|uniref:hypothetical protein n=1 Tax=Myxosarcina sp. GI1 TaxID=1541065 RepID=UPI00056316AE|nr:hypothetical protein [Myxosarcina sp. GI1]